MFFIIIILKFLKYICQIIFILVFGCFSKTELYTECYTARCQFDKSKNEKLFNISKILQFAISFYFKPSTAQIIFFKAPKFVIKLLHFVFDTFV
jgi:hypothetical protein